MAAIWQVPWLLPEIAHGGLQASCGCVGPMREQCGHKIGGGGRIYAPVRDQQAPCAGLAEGLGQAGKRLGDALHANECGRSIGIHAGGPVRVWNLRSLGVYHRTGNALNPNRRQG